ncbi:dihydrodipicolinate synthase family protein [Candidatus Poribacteria bacterium]|nr:dihydrodipicolinate synthase family protein [Candidatus Poribacteria bacterium]
MAERFAGAWPVLLTPFAADGSIDLGAYRTMLEWYIARGVGGFYANCSSSEMFVLENNERLSLARGAVEASAGRVPVTATGNFGETLAEQIAFCRQMGDTGVDAVVIRVPDHETTDEELRTHFLAFADTLDCPLGVYECPSPVRRLLPASLTRELAQTGRFLAFKETSCDPAKTAAQAEAARGTPLGIFQANTPFLPEAMADGCAGTMSLAANVDPEDAAAVTASGGTDASAHARLCQFDFLTRLGHPLVSKEILAARGVPISATTRVLRGELSPEFRRGLRRAVEGIVERGIAPA